MVRKQRRDSEAVEKGSLAAPCNFRIIKNQEVTSDGKSKNDRIWGFSTASAVMFYLKNEIIRSYWWESFSRIEDNELKLNTTLPNEPRAVTT
jgi:hypothetical protein